MKLVLVLCIIVNLLTRLYGLPQEVSEIELPSDLEDYDEDYGLADLQETGGDLTQVLLDENEDDEYNEWNKCDKDLSEPRGVRKYLDWSFLKKFFRNLVPFRRPQLQMNFYLFKRDFPNCGRELSMDDDEIWQTGLNASHPTRIIIHGWMSQSRGSFNLDVKNAYLKRGDFNVIVADWSANAANINYFRVVKVIEIFGALVAQFTQHLYEKARIDYDDVYLIGHSLGAQIAGAAGKRSWPHHYNTIFALDPAGPRFRRRSTEFRIDPTDAKYVESMHTSFLGFSDPTGNATFYPNYGNYQKQCYYVGCSHIRAYRMFAESITSDVGFWGIRCSSRKPKWQCDDMAAREYRMGGEPSQPKAGLFYVKTNARPPYALGKMQMNDMDML